MDTSATPIVTQETSSHTGLAVVQRYEGAVNYLYPLLLNMSHKHRVLRDLLAAWRGHAQWANARNLLTKLGATA